MTTWNRDDSDLSTLTGISSTTVGSVRITGNTIGLTSDTDLLSLADGALTVNGSITGTLLTSAQTSITSLGTLTSLTVDNIILNGTTIGHTDDTDLISIASGALTINGTLTSTGAITGTLATAAQTNITSLGTLSTLDVNGTTNLDAVDIDGNVQVDGTFTVGVDGTGKDVKFYGDDPGNFMLWDQSGDKLEIRNDYAKAGLLLSNTDAGSTNSPAIDFYRNSASAAASDALGICTFKGRNADNDADVIYARLKTVILDATKGGEEGEFQLGVMANGTFVQNVIDLTGQSDGTVDVDIGSGSASVTTLRGDLTITGGNITNAITFDSGITDAGTISAGTWSGTALVAAKVPAHDDLTGFVANEHIDWTGASAGTIHATNYTNTTYTGGTNLTLDGTTFNVDDAFLVNNGNDTMTGTLTIDKNSTATSSTTTKGMNIDFDHTGISASGQTIQNFGIDMALNSNSPTHVGTVYNTGLRMNLSAGSSGTQVQYGIYSDVAGGDTNIGYYGNTGDSDIDFKISGDDANSYFTLATGAHGATTLATVDDGGEAADLILDADGATIVSIIDGSEVDGFHVSIAGATNRMFSAYGEIDNFSSIRIYEMGGASTSDYFGIDVSEHGATSITTQDSTGSQADIIINPDGTIRLAPGTATWTARPIGFTQNEPTFNATDTIVTFSTTGNKQKLTLTNNVTDIHFKFPAYSGNFICVLLQDGTGGRTISNWKTQDSAGNAGAGNSGLVLWAGGLAPSNTETANKADIVSFYWDADNEIAYGTYTYNF